MKKEDKELADGTIVKVEVNQGFHYRFDLFSGKYFTIYCKSERDAHTLLATLQTVDVECERQGS